MTNISKRVLIVDDEPSHCLLLKLLFLEVWGLDVVLIEANDGKEAVLLTQQWQPHLILMDLWMPGMNGYEAIEHIRNLEKSHVASVKSPHLSFFRTRIIAISADVSESSRSLAFSAGCDDFVHKPYIPEELYESIKQHTTFIDYYLQVYHPPSIGDRLCVA